MRSVDIVAKQALVTERSHPRATSFCFTRKEICIEKANVLAGDNIEDFVDFHFGMIGRDLFCFFESQTVKTAGMLENSFADIFKFEVGAKVFFVESIFFFFELFGIVGKVQG